MLNLAEYRSRADRLADHLPWAALVAPGVILNKDGSFMRSFAFRGSDLESATEAELVSACARANNVLKRLGSGWALFFEAERREALGYPESAFPDAASWLVEQERRAGFEAEGQHFESVYHGTLVWLPPADSSDAAGRTLVERPDDAKGRDWHASLAGFIAETDRVFDLLSGFMPEVRPLSDAETLTYLHGTVSSRPHPVAVPETPIYLDALLADTPLAKIDDIEFVRTIAVARITMPMSMVRLSAGRESMSEATQALCFMAGANSIFTGDKLLTAANAGDDKDAAMLAKLGLVPMVAEEPLRACKALEGVTR